jgi:hypothetical protein
MRAATRRDAAARGVPIAGLCLYPITAYSGWDNSRHAEVGLLSTVGADGERRLFLPLVEELDRQRKLFSTSLGPAGASQHRTLEV